MSITEFLALINFKPYGSVINSWDSFSPTGSVLMQLWADQGRRVRDINKPEVYMRVLCFDSAHYEQTSINGNNHKVGYSGRLNAISKIERGAKGYTALSSPSGFQRGRGVWARYADFTKVYPILQIEHPENTSDIFALLGKPIPLSEVV